MKTYYLYKHIRPDKNEIFYIGIGTKINSKSNHTVYRRAFTNRNRNTHWLNIVKNNPDYIIKIILESDDIDFIKQKEIEYVKLYGRIDLKLGTLCNLTDGGDGLRNYVTKEDTKLLLSKIGKGRKQNKAWVEKRIKNRIGLKMSKEWIDKRNKSRKDNADKRGYYVSKEKRLIGSKSVLQYDMNNVFIKEWKIISDAARFYNICKGNIIKVCKGKAKHCNSFIWKYKYEKDMLSHVPIEYRKSLTI